MIARRMFFFLFSLFCFSPLFVAAQSTTAEARRVMTWIPPYAIAASQQQLYRLYNGAGPRNGLTHLGLQFWKPTTVGGLQREAAFGAISNTKIAQFVAWGDTNKVKVMLCVFNADAATGSWDWELAKAAFMNPTNRARFINALIAEMQARSLDGIDVDLEGLVAENAEEKAAYLALIRALATRVHQLGKEITVDTFPYIWNAPNQTWWPQIFPYVDGITSMGYSDLGRNAPGWQSYLSQKRAAGNYVRKLMIGMPSYLSEWQGDTAAAQAQWFLTAAAGNAGIGIWDAQFQAAAWRTAAVWQRLKAVREAPVRIAGAAASR